MSELKCPFCNGKLYGCIGHPYCRNEKCEMCDEMMPQELLDLLERTRKALEMTDIALLTIATNLDKVFPDTRLIFETIRIARKRIAEITALEQKE